MSQYLDLSYYKSHYGTIPPNLLPIKYKDFEHSERDLIGQKIQLARSEYGSTIYNLIKSDKYVEIVYKNSLEHGIFIEKFINGIVKKDILSKIIEDEIDIEDLYPLFCTQYNFGSFEKVKKHLLGHIALDAARVLYYHTIDLEIYSNIESWYYKHKDKRKCSICDKDFRVISLPDWVYYGSNGQTKVCFECPVIEKPSKEKVKRWIPELINYCGFIPNSNFSPIEHSFSSRINSTNSTKVLDIVFKLRDWKSVYEDWFLALIDAEILDNNVLKTGRGYRCLSNSGNVCNSLDEQFIDNWMFERGLQIVKEPHYPKHNIYNKSGRRRADWLVNGVYIEYFGLSGDVNYDRKTEEKKSLIKDLRLKLICLYPEDLNNLKVKLGVLMGG